MGRFMSATGQFLSATNGHNQRPPMGSSRCPLTVIDALAVGEPMELAVLRRITEQEAIEEANVRGL